jgi:hypothetical protein
VGVAAVEKMGCYGKLALRGHVVFTDEDSAAAYCSDNGRPSVSPSMLAKARLLQCYAAVSDAEVIERCRFDLRWKGRVAAGGSVKGSELVDWGNVEQVDAFLGRLLEDCDRAVQLAGEAGCGSEEVELRRRVIAQDVELGDPGGGRG